MASKTPHTFSFFESPHRIATTLAEIAPLLGERQIALGRELTKLHQEFIRGSAATLSGLISELKGEVTAVVGPINIGDSSSDQILATAGLQGAVEMFWRLTKEGRPRRQALSEAGRSFSVPLRVLYSAIEEAKKTSDESTS
jgi:16S rRNA (cytidine1402-2'-O)-methyltransferase